MSEISGSNPSEGEGYEAMPAVELMKLCLSEIESLAIELGPIAGDAYIPEVGNKLDRASNLFSGPVDKDLPAEEREKALRAKYIETLRILKEAQTLLRISRHESQS